MKIAAFDFDGTITKRDSFWDFLVYTWGYPKVCWKMMLRLPVILLYKVGIVSNEQAKECLFSCFFRGIAGERFEEMCTRYSKTLPAIVRPQALACVSQYLAEGAEVVIVTASVENWIRPWARQMGIRRVIGTQIEIGPDGKLTGAFASPNCYGPEKVRRLLEKYPDRATYRLYAYGDSKGDRELLEFADRAFWQVFPKE